MTKDGSTRRDFVTYGGLALGGSMLAGCAGTGESETTTSAATTTGSTTNVDESYTVTMSPMGEVSFEAVPETIFTRLTHLAGMAFALGRGGDVNAMHEPEYYDALWNQFTPRLPGVELDWTGLYSSWQPSKEKLYELDSDVHLADPASVFALDDWNMSDLDEISEAISPWFGNTFSGAHKQPPSQWPGDYEYYTLWEQFEKVAQVFQAGEQYDALKAVHDDVHARIESSLPSEGNRPSIVMGGFSDPSAPYVYNVDTPGFLTAHVRPFAPVDAFDDDVTSASRIDMETLLEADPDVIFVLGGMHPTYDMASIRSTLADDPVAGEVTAVQNGRIYAQGARYQGPILNLFQLEMTAKQLYPDTFGAWPTYEEGPYPEIPADEQFFDRQRVADVINGAV